MNVKPLLLILFFLAYSFFCGRYYVCTIKQACGNGIKSEIDSLPISFHYGSSIPITTSEVGSYLDSILAKSDSSNILEITGFWDSRELDSTNTQNLGLERAYSILGFLNLDSLSYRLNSNETVLDSTDLLDAIRFRWYTKNDKVEESENKVILYGNDDEFRGRLNPKVSAILRFISIEHSDKIIELIGHSYDRQLEGENFTTGLDMANRVRSELIDFGLNEFQVTATSRGQVAPMNEYDSLSRVEVIINN